MMVMGIIASSVMMVALRTFTTTATITDRRDVFADGRVAEPITRALAGAGTHIV